MKKVILMHGKDVGPHDKWYPWFQEQCKQQGWKYSAPELPKAADPVLDEWVEELSKCKPDQDTVLVGHSRGGVAVLRLLEQQEPSFRVKGVILLATNSGLESESTKSDESNHGFYTPAGYNFEEIKKHCENFYVLHSKDDHMVPYKAGLKNAAGFGVDIISFEDRRHFWSKTDGTYVTEIPELIEIISSL